MLSDMTSRMVWEPLTHDQKLEMLMETKRDLTLCMTLMEEPE